MAGRSAGYKHLQSTRDKIQASALINRLHDHSMAESPIMDASQVNSAKALLNKVLPDLKAIEVSGDPDAPLEHRIEIEVIDSEYQGPGPEEA